jgi:hypothetical protein
MAKAGAGENMNALVSSKVLTGVPAEHDHFITVRKSDIVRALIEHGSLDADAADKFRQLCRMLGAIYHHRYFSELEKLRDAYFYFNPALKPPTHLDPAASEQAYAELIAALTAALKSANFIEVPQAEIEQAHRERVMLRVEVKVPMNDFREVRFFRRGRRKEIFEFKQWFGLRKRRIEAEVYEDVVVLVAIKPSENLPEKEVKRLEKLNTRPGCVFIKYFRNLASADLNALFPNVRVVMSTLDKLILSIPALAGGIPILINLASTLTVLFVVLGFYLGVSGAVHDDEMKKAFAAMSGLVALGGVCFRQWISYQRRSLKYQKELTDNVYFRNINNNAGIFDTITGVAEDQECKEAFLAFYFLHAAGAKLDQRTLEKRIEAWLKLNFGIAIEFEVDDALAKLDRLGLLKREGDKLRVSSLEETLMQLDRVWDSIFSPTGETRLEQIPRPRRGVDDVGAVG